MFELPHDVLGGLQRHRPPRLGPVCKAPWHTTAGVVVIGSPDLRGNGPVLRDYRDVVPMISEHRLIGIHPRERFRIARHQQPLDLGPPVIHKHRPVAEGRALAARTGHRRGYARQRLPRHQPKKGIVSQRSEKKDLCFRHLAYRHNLPAASTTKPQSAPPIKSVPQTGMVRDCRKYSMEMSKVATTASHGAS